MLPLRVGTGRSLVSASILALTVALAGCSADGKGTASSLPEVGSGTEVRPGESYVLRVGTHCGVERLGLPVNDVFWITDEAGAASTDWMPAEWASSVEDGLIPLTIVLSANGAELKAEASDRAVTYRPLNDGDGDGFCE